MSSSTTISKPAGSPRRFVCLLLATACGLLLVLGALNYWVDPYNRFGNNRLGVFISAEREAKPVMVQRYPHDALIVGNSKAAMIPASQVKAFRFFNASFAGASLEEEYYFMEHFARDLKLVVLEADYLQTDPLVTQGDTFAPAGFAAIFEFLFSAKSVEYSVRTLTEHFKGTPASIHPDGTADASGWFKLYDGDDRAAREWQLNRLAATLEGAPAGPAHYYARIAALLRDRHIPCVVFVPPMDQELLDHFRTEARQKVFNQWKSELQKDFACVIDLSSAPYSGDENFFKTDPYHFKPGTGLRLMNEKVVPAALQAAAAAGAVPQL